MNKMLINYSIQISTPDMFTPPEDLLSRPDHPWHGAAIMWHSSLNSSSVCLKTTNSRFASIRTQIQDQKFLAFSVYFPTSGKDDEYLEVVSDLTNFVLDNQTEDEVLLLGSDTNCSSKSTQRRIHAYERLLKDLNLVSVSTIHPTFHHHNGSSESNIDSFLVSKGYASRLVNPEARCTLHNPENLSAHDPLVSTLQVRESLSKPDGNKFSHTYTKFDQLRVNWDDQNLDKYKHITDEVLLEFDKMFPLPQHIPLKCELFSNLLVKCAELSLVTKHIDRIPKKNKKSSPILHHTWQVLRKCFKKWKEGGKVKDDSETFKEYKDAKRLFQQRYRQESMLKNIWENNTIMKADYSNKKEFYKIIKNLRSNRLTGPTSTLCTPKGVFYGEDILEGFTVDAEMLGQVVGEAAEYDNEFYRLCVLDNSYIFEVKGEDTIKIPEMKLENLEDILNKEMKLRKACDIYKLTVEHLRYAGAGAKLIILKLLNDIIKNIYYLTCPQIKKGLSTAIFKGKKKPLSESSSYRRITVTPCIGSILDRYIDPMAEDLFLKTQSPDQLGFTRHVSYLMAAVERGECQRYALDTNQTCFGVSFDGKAAFPSVDRDIQVRELYASGESGDLLQYSRNTYQNTVSHVKLGGKLGRQLREYKGARQGHKRAGGHFKAYMNPCLVATSSSLLGFWIGPICVSCVCVADDTYILSGNPRSLQALVNIVAHYGRRYRVLFGADKTKVTITGSKHDMAYYKDMNIWNLDGDPLAVADDNEHLGLIVSGLDEEIKNVDKKIDSARQTLFSLLGNVFSFKCKISPSVLLHVWSLYVKPVLRSGLSSLPIRPQVMISATKFHRKILRGILKLGPVSPIPPLYFLLGELPVEAMIHLDTLTLFWSIWANPQTKIYEIIKYLLMMSKPNSLTWAAHVRLLCQIYQLPDPLALISGPLWSKDRWKMMTKTAVITHHERKLRDKAATNSKLGFLNVKASGLSGRPHPVLFGVFTTQEVMRTRVHLKMLAGDYPCSAYIGSDRGQDTSCKLCKVLHPQHPPPTDDLVHVLTECRVLSDTRSRYIPDLLNTIAQHLPLSQLLVNTNNTELTQFILDPTSLNLPPVTRISPDHPALSVILSQCRNLCHVIHKQRIKQLKSRTN